MKEEFESARKWVEENEVFSFDKVDSENFKIFCDFFGIKIFPHDIKGNLQRRLLNIVAELAHNIIKHGEKPYQKLYQSISYK